MRRMAGLWCVLLVACNEDLAVEFAVDAGVGSHSSALVSHQINCDGTDKHDEIQAHFNQIVPFPIHIVLSPGLCVVTGPLIAHSGRITIEGAGPTVTRIRFIPTGARQALFTFWGENVTLKSLALQSGLGPELDEAKTALSIHGGNFNLENVAIRPWDAATVANETTGIELIGGEAVTFRKVRIEADLPLLIRAAAWSIEHAHFKDMYLQSSAPDESANPPSPVVKIEPGSVLRHVTFDGTQAWVHGGLHWVDGGVVAARSSTHLRIANVRVEGVCEGVEGLCDQPDPASRPWAIRIEKNPSVPPSDPAPAKLDDLLVEFSLTAGRGIGVQQGGRWNGIRANGVGRTVLRQVVYDGTSIDFDGDGILSEDP
jgi:hypothetical protein